MEQLPAEIQNEFPAFESIDRYDAAYIAKPRFIPYPPDHFIGSSMRSWYNIFAAKDGKRYMCRSYSPQRNSRGKGGFDVTFCQLT